MEKTLSRSEAKAVYDRFGAKQDSQGFYEDAAIAELIRHADFEHAQRVFELGCGTGRLAVRLLQHHLPQSAKYYGIDISATMVEIARRRVSAFGTRATTREVDGAIELGDIDPVDRVITTYVLDLLPEQDIVAFVTESARVLKPGGRLCVANLTGGRTLVARTVTAIWRTVFKLSPRLVGGCRPISLRAYLNDDTWRVLHQGVVSPFGIASEVIVAERLKATR